MQVIPRNWSQVTVETFMELQKTFKEEPETPSELLELLIKRAVILTDLEVSQIEELPAEELYKVNDLLKLPMPTKISRFIRLKGHLYKVQTNPNRIKGTVHKFFLRGLFTLNFDPKEDNTRTHMSVMNNCKDGGANSMHRIMFNICKPVKSIWNTKEIKLSPAQIEERIEDFKQLPISLVNPVVVFFCELTKRLTTDIQEYSDQKMMELNQMVAEQTAILESMDG